MLDVQAATDRRLGIFGGDDAVLLRAVLIRDDVYERLCCVIMQQCANIAWILRDISRMFLRITFLRTAQIGSEINMRRVRLRALQVGSYMASAPDMDAIFESAW